jgi:hypothetical protein
MYPVYIITRESYRNLTKTLKIFQNFDYLEGIYYNDAEDLWIQRTGRKYAYTIVESDPRSGGSEDITK